MTDTPALAALDTACPAPPEGCGSPAGELCTSHSGTRVRRDSVHQARTAAHRIAMIAANPAARLVAEAAATRSGMHGSHAADLLDEHGHTEAAALIRDVVAGRRGHLSAKQAVQLLLDTADPSLGGRS
ncbi:hypothetical protein [Streptomyces synnematoformans]|uniref:DNA-binding phage zinc finger domain-containing protein n=1 Tax=Streptomyces synnematoformans TaxID=415721 RepID=A0ABP5IZI3_9ACTN